MSTYKIYDFDGKIFHFGFIGRVTGELVDEFLEELENTLQNFSPENPMGLLSDSGQEQYLTPQARRRLARLVADQRIQRIAIFNMARVNRVVATFVMKAVGRTHIHFFDTEEEARAWLTAD